MNSRLWFGAVIGIAVPFAASAQTDAKPVTITGFVTTSLTTATNTDGEQIVGRLYGRRKNEFMFNVANVMLERAVATDKMDAGVRVEAMFGQNAAVVKSNGLDLGSNADIWQAYGVLNIPLSGTGRYMQIKGGKMATLVGVEVGEDILNPNLDVGYQDVLLEPFTETGVEIGFKFGAKADAQLRVINGWDQVEDVNTAKSLMLRLGLTPDDRTLLAITGFTGPEQAGDNGPKRTGLNVVASRKFGASTSLMAQIDFGQEDEMAPGGESASWTGFGAWLTQDLGPKNSLALRVDQVNDSDGARTSGVLGFPVNDGQTLSSFTATLNIKAWPHALVRPEIRFDHSSLEVFDGKKSGLTFAVGWSYIF